MIKIQNNIATRDPIPSFPGGDGGGEYGPYGSASGGQGGVIVEWFY